MWGELSIGSSSLLIVAGVLCAAGLLYAIKNCNHKTRLVISALALLIAVLVYVLLALRTANPLFIGIELVGLVLFLFLIWLGYRYSFWFIPLGWLLHVLWDIGLYPAQTAPYVPHWYAWLCVGFDVVMALYLIVILARDEHP